MENANNIRKYVKNMEYCAGEIIKFTRDQIDIDHRNLMDPKYGSIRIDSLGAIAGLCGNIQLYCEGILANVKNAEELDKKLVNKDNT